MDKSKQNRNLAIRRQALSIKDDTGKLIVLLWAAFIGVTARALFADVNLIRQGGRIVLGVTIAIIIIYGLCGLKKTSVSQQRRVNVATIVYFSVCLFAFAWGIIRNASSPYLFVYGAAPAFLVALYWFDLKIVDQKRLQGHFLWHLRIGIVIALMAIAGLADATRDDWYGEETLGGGVGSISCLYALFFLLPNVSRLTLADGLTVLVGLGLYVAHTMAAHSRGMFVAVVVCSSFAAIETFRAAFRREVGILSLIRLLVVAGIISAVGVGVGWQRLNMAEKVWGTIGRLSNEDINYAGGRDVLSGAIATSQAEYLETGGRAVEAREYISAMAWHEWLIGKGFGGQWDSASLGPNRPMVHFMPLHFIHMGGVAFFGSFCAVLILTGKRAFWSRTMRPAKASALCYVVYYMMNIINHGGSFGDNIETIAFWSCLALLNVQPMEPSPVAYVQRERTINSTANFLVR